MNHASAALRRIRLAEKILMRHGFSGVDVQCASILGVSYIDLTGRQSNGSLEPAGRIAKYLEKLAFAGGLVLLTSLEVGYSHGVPRKRHELLLDLVSLNLLRITGASTSARTRLACPHHNEHVAFCNFRSLFDYMYARLGTGVCAMIHLWPCCALQ